VHFCSTRALSLPLLLVTALPACHGAKPRTAAEPGTSFVVTAEAIEKSGATTAWEALQFTVPVVSFRGTSESGSNRELRIKRRGRSSLYLNDDPRVFIDQVRIADISVLEGMPAGDIAAIVVLSGLDGTTYYGTSAGNGVVLIFTHAKTPPQPEESEEHS